MQTLRWAQVKWLDNDPNTAGYLCDAEGCGALWSNAERIFAVRCGKWIAEHPERKVAGFHISELYASFRTLAEIVADFLDAKDAPEKLKTFINTSLAEVWRDEKGEKVDADTLAERCEDYDVESVPAGAIVVTMAVDVQDDRLEVEFVGWGIGEECWGIDHVVLRGDPGTPELWNRVLDDQLARTFRAKTARCSRSARAAIDTAGHFTKQAYAWSGKHRARRVYRDGRSRRQGPAARRAGKKVVKQGQKLFTVGVDTAKELLLFSRVKITKVRPGVLPLAEHVSGGLLRAAHERASSRPLHEGPSHARLGTSKGGATRRSICACSTWRRSCCFARTYRSSPSG
jgi:phage terminase large subunit GpA-like protein